MITGANHRGCSGERFRDRGGVVTHHGEVGGSRAVLCGKGVGEELAADADAGFAGDRLEQGVAADVFDEERGDVVAADLRDQSGELFG